MHSMKKKNHVTRDIKVSISFFFLSLKTESSASSERGKEGGRKAGVSLDGILRLLLNLDSRGVWREGVSTLLSGKPFATY